MRLISVLILAERGHLWLSLELAAHLTIVLEAVAITIELDPMIGSWSQVIVDILLFVWMVVHVDERL